MIIKLLLDFYLSIYLSILICLFHVCFLMFVYIFP